MTIKVEIESEDMEVTSPTVDAEGKISMPEKYAGHRVKVIIIDEVPPD